MSGPAFAVEVERFRAGVKLTVRGEIDIDTVRQLEHARERALADRPEWMVIDPSAVGFIDSSGPEVPARDARVIAARQLAACTAETPR
jgi:anti-anti-sigma factor